MIIEILVVAPGGKPGAFLMLLYLLQTPVKQVGRTDNPVVQHPAFRQLPLRAERFTDKADAFAHHDRDGVDSQAVQQSGFYQRGKQLAATHHQHVIFLFQFIDPLQRFFGQELHAAVRCNIGVVV